MAAPLVSDDRWALVEPLLPPHPPRPKGGRPPVPDRACVTGIVFVLKTGIQWEDLPQDRILTPSFSCVRTHKTRRLRRRVRSSHASCKQRSKAATPTGRAF
jgi:transposase